MKRSRGGRARAFVMPNLIDRIRYNAASPGAEIDIFPHLAKRKPAIFAYTATRWRGLLKRPKGWNDPVMTPSDCYRFCLSNSPHL